MVPERLFSIPQFASARPSTLIFCNSCCRSRLWMRHDADNYQRSFSDCYSGYQRTRQMYAEQTIKRETPGTSKHEGKRYRQIENRQLGSSLRGPDRFVPMSFESGDGHRPHRGKWAKWVK